MPHRMETANLDGLGPRPYRVYYMAAGRDYWTAITDVACPANRCEGTVRRADAGNVPAYRICDGCGRHYLGGGTALAPTLRLMRGKA